MQVLFTRFAALEVQQSRAKEIRPRRPNERPNKPEPPLAPRLPSEVGVGAG